MHAMSRRIESVLFDLDNTLIDRTGAFRSFCVELYRTNGAIQQACSEQEAVSFMVDLDQDGMCDRRMLFGQVILKWPGSFEDEEEAVRMYMSRYPKLASLDPSTLRLLDDVRSRGVPVGIVTNGSSEMQWAKVRSTGLVDLVDGVVVSGDLGIHKPDPRIFEHALAKIDARAEGTLFVGDNPVADILGASAVGMTSAWIRLGREWPFADRPPDYAIDHVSEARAIVFG